MADKVRGRRALCSAAGALAGGSIVVVLAAGLFLGGCRSESSGGYGYGAAGSTTSTSSNTTTSTSSSSTSATSSTLGANTANGPDSGSDMGDSQMANSQKSVEFVTSMGAFVIELDAAAAPLTVENFLAYVDAGFFDDTVFHRVIPGFMAQGGGFSADMRQKPTNAPVKNEADNGLKNLRGTVAMARTNVVDSATAQFFVNVADNAFLDHSAKTMQGYGYAVFGKVVSGMEVIDAMVAVPTTTMGRSQDVPRTPIVIESAKVLVEE